MVIVESYPLAVVLCVVTMVCWGSWVNTQRLASPEWPFRFFNWDYSIGVLVTALVFAFTLGSHGTEGRGFIPDILQAENRVVWSAFIGGAIFNLANILVITAINSAGMAVAFPVGIGLALIVGVVANYIAVPLGNPLYLFSGVALVVAAIVMDALAYRRMLAGRQTTPGKALLFAIVGGLIMGFFYRFVAASLATDFAAPEKGFMTPYTAIVFFAAGLLLSNILFNRSFTSRPPSGSPAATGNYFAANVLGQHIPGLLGGMIWCVGMTFSIIASNAAGFAISYGLCQGSILVGTAWGVFIWREFRSAPKGTSVLLGLMFLSFIAGLGMIILARVV